MADLFEDDWRDPLTRFRDWLDEHHALRQWPQDFAPGPWESLPHRYCPSGVPVRWNLALFFGDSSIVYTYSDASISEHTLTHAEATWMQWIQDHGLVSYDPEHIWLPQTSDQAGMAQQAYMQWWDRLWRQADEGTLLHSPYWVQVAHQRLPQWCVGLLLSFRELGATPPMGVSPGGNSHGESCGDQHHSSKAPGSED